MPARRLGGPGPPGACLLENTANTVLLQFGRSKGLLEPARWPRRARMRCSSPHSVPPERSKGLLEPPLGAPRALKRAARARSVPQGRSNGLLEPTLGAPRALEGVARAATRCPQGARRGCSSLLGAPGYSKWLLKPLLGAPHVRSERHFEPLLGAAGGPRATSCITERSRRRSRMLLEESVVGYT